MKIEPSNAVEYFFPQTSLVQVMFEAIANAFDAGASTIWISIEIEKFTPPDTLKITITDNGEGFTNDRFDRFRELLKPIDATHKGLGRLVYLRYFNRIQVDSVFGQRKRHFIFAKDWNETSKVEVLESAPESFSKLVFSNFSNERIKARADITPGLLKQRIIHQFLPTLIERRDSGRDFTINLDLQTAESNQASDFFSGAVAITKADLPHLTTVVIQDNFFDDYEGIEMRYCVKAGIGERNFLIGAIIDGRTVPIDLLKPEAVPPNHSVIFLFSSKLFYGKADASRQKLVLPDSVSEPELIRILRRHAGNEIANAIPEIGKRNIQTEKQFEERFPHLLGLFDKTTVGIVDRNEALEVAQRKFFNAQKEVLQSVTMDDATYAKSLELASRTLTEYILYRDIIVKKLKDMTSGNVEADIHNLICPQYIQFDGAEIADCAYRNNAWLLDDKYMSFQTILSEARMCDVVKAITPEGDASNEVGRPDITMIFSNDPDAGAADVVVVEIKKKSDDEKDNLFAINQLLERAAKLAAYCPNIQLIWYYAVIEISEAIEVRLRQLKYTSLFSSGKVYYQEFPTERPDKTIVPTPVFVVSFDAIVSDAQSRNRTFLEILRAGMKRLSHSQSVNIA